MGSPAGEYLFRQLREPFGGTHFFHYWIRSHLATGAQAQIPFSLLHGSTGVKSKWRCSVL